MLWKQNWIREHLEQGGGSFPAERVCEQAWERVWERGWQAMRGGEAMPWVFGAPGILTDQLSTRPAYLSERKDDTNSPWRRTGKGGG